MAYSLSLHEQIVHYCKIYLNFFHIHVSLQLKFSIYAPASLHMTRIVEENIQGWVRIVMLLSNSWNNFNLSKLDPWASIPQYDTHNVILVSSLHTPIV